jgi:DNA uptake protein ComE-like DNA-binding protein
MEPCVITQHQVRRSAFILVIVVCLGYSCGGLVLICSTEQAASLPSLEKINPNTAPVGSLVRLPGIGPLRAQMLISYRDQFYRQQATQRAFTCPADIVKVRGLGTKTVAGFGQYLDFK